MGGIRNSVGIKISNVIVSVGLQYYANKERTIDGVDVLIFITLRP